MNEPKNQDVKGVLIVYADGLTGIKEAIVVIFPKIGYRCCILPFLELRKNGIRSEKWGLREGNTNHANAAFCEKVVLL